MLNNQEIEKEILEFWKKNKIFEKLRKQNENGDKWSFIDGPITANNPMGVHHAWGRTYKDLFQRFKSMQGFELRYQNGFDCQGLWIEREEEKDLGLKSKEDIEKFGILKFVKSCRKRVEKFSKIQRDQSIRLGYWMDWDNSYYTMSDENQLHNWYLMKTYFDKGWLYKGKDAVPWCWRCGTASSKHDITTEGYKDVTHMSLFMQFPLKNEKNTYFLIFTTTPWTVPANVALAVNEKIDYVKVENNDKKYWIAKSRLEELDGKYKILETVKGSKLKGIEYIMPYAEIESQKDSPHKIVMWDLASKDEGTGIVHIAPGCGTDDFVLGKKEKLPSPSPLNSSGIYIEGFGQFSGKKYSEVTKEVLKDLKERNFSYKTNSYKHRYPHCWRCGEELVYRLVDEWYIKSKDIREKLISENKKVKWYPEYGKVRQNEWFNNMSDWLISRKRYWGFALPIWECDCGNIEVMGSLEELKKKAIDKKKVDNLPEIHRPWIDEIKIKCEKCGDESSRILDVGDAWLDAGIVPFSTLNYLKDKKYWNKWFPADMISENMPGQSRGWFNALFWASVTITGKAPFKSLFGYESLKDEKGEEMHKSKGNAIWFDEAIEKIGADPIRFLYCLQDPSQELKFGFNVVKDPKNNINILHNISKLIEKSKEVKINRIEDKWILSKLNSLIEKMSEELNNMHPHLSTRAVRDFWLNDLSRGYIQFIRDRLANEDNEAKYVLKEVYITLIKLCAPIIPFTMESIWQDLKNKKIVNEESVHLSSWPKPDKKKIDVNLENHFSIVFEIIERGLRERDKSGIGLKWPLANAKINSKESLDKELIEIVKEQLNVKKIEIKIGKEFLIELDTNMTPDLEVEGYARNIARGIQALRKKVGLVKENLIELIIVLDKESELIIKDWEKFLKERTNAKKISIKNEFKDSNFVDEKLKIKNKCFHIYLKKIE